MIKSNILFQPSGQNEGFPHSLADAICSGCDVIVDSKLIIQLGLNYYKSKKIGNFHLFLREDCKNLAAELDFRQINLKYLDLIKKYSKI